MKYEFKMPDLATTGSAIKILHWLVQPGEAVTRGQFLVEVETDKASMEVECTTTGTLAKICVAEGESIDVGEVIAWIETANPSEASATTSPAPQNPAPSPSAPMPGGLFARNRAAKTPDPVAPPLPSAARRTASRRLQESKQSIPHFYLQTSFNAEPMQKARAAFLPDKLAWEAFFVKAVHQALTRFPQMAFRWENDRLLPQGTDTIGVAADIGGDLFVLPLVRPGDHTVSEISQSIRSQVGALRDGDLRARGLKPGVMTISNLGACNVESFTAIINPPESGILAIGKIQPVVIATSDTTFAIQRRANLTLSVDHRVVNGKYAAEFLGEIVAQLENL